MKSRISISLPSDCLKTNTPVSGHGLVEFFQHSGHKVPFSLDIRWGSNYDAQNLDSRGHLANPGTTAPGNPSLSCISIACLYLAVNNLLLLDEDPGGFRPTGWPSIRTKRVAKTKFSWAVPESWRH